MQLHTLTVTAFGPFADRQQVDFDALSASGLFLLHGATGAGKTSVLDAVCFALYGQLPGARAGSRSLRSDHAAAGVRPEVVLEATLRGRRVRLTRSPLWERPKHRGSGTTIEQAHVRLDERRDGGWRTLSTRLDETGLEVRRLLGLDVTQFCQVVLLPQGQFAEFLRADADRRRALLESLFDTERFADVERWLVDQRKHCTRALEDIDRRLDAVLARLSEVVAGDAGADLHRPGDVPLDATTARGWVATLHAEAITRVGDLEAAVVGLDSRRAAATRSWHDGRRLQDARLRHAALRARLDRLHGRATQRTEVEVTLLAARRAAPVVPLVAELHRLDTSLALASGELLTRQQQVATLGLAGGGSGTAASGALEALRGQREAIRSELGGLEALAPLEQEAADLSDAIDRFERDVVALDQQRAEAERWLETADRRSARLADAVDAALRAAERVEAGRARVGELADRWESALDRDRLDLVIADTETLLRDAVDGTQRRREMWLDLRAARLDGMAAELATRLVIGEACPVCGSCEHPTPGTGNAPTVTREQEQAAEQAFDQADAVRTDVARALSTARATRAAAAARAARSTSATAPCGPGPSADLVSLRGPAAAAADPTADALHEEHARAQEDQARDEALAAGLVDAQLAEAAFAAQRASRSADQLRLDEQARAIRARGAEAAARQSALQSRLVSARGHDPTLAARSARLAELVGHLDALVDAVSSVDRLGDELTSARARAVAAAAERGLASLDEVRRLSRPDDELARLEEQRRRHDEELAAVSEQLADDELVRAAAAPAPDLATLETAAAECDRCHARHVGDLTSARTRATALTRLAGDLDAVLADRVPVARQHAVVDGLSRLAEGKSADNLLRMSLSAYVLTARLEQVAAAASERLTRMSSGRYSLSHSTDATSARGRGGLHLRVLDAWTGIERDPATLSGGESFSASLALALGLADVVTAEAGGSLLETLFVDEGFGSLDDDTLDEVMGVLDDLREGGRAVGLVSHVADLRQRIPVQLHVDKGRQGSTIRQ